MIDTIHLNIPLSPDEFKYLSEKAHFRFLKINQDYHIKWDKPKFSSPTWNPYINISIDRYQRLSIRFSIHKALFHGLYGIRYNHENYNFDTAINIIDITLLELSEFLNFAISPYDPRINIQQMDIGIVIETHNIEVIEFYNSIKKYFGRSIKNDHKYGDHNDYKEYSGVHSLHYGSRWVTKKIYSKLFEYQEHAKETNKTSPALQTEYHNKSLSPKEAKKYNINNSLIIENYKQYHFKQISLADFIDTIKNRHRIEYGYNSQFLIDKGFNTLHNFRYNQGLFYTYLAKPVLHQAFELQKMIKDSNNNNNLNELTVKELELLNNLKQYGYKGAQYLHIKKYSRADFYNQCINLKAKGINPHFLWHSQIDYNALSLSHPEVSICEFVNIDNDLFSGDLLWLLSSKI